MPWAERKPAAYCKCPGIVAYVGVHACICTHGYESHNPWHTVYYSLGIS